SPFDCEARAGVSAQRRVWNCDSAGCSGLRVLPPDFRDEDQLAARMGRSAAGVDGIRAHGAGAGGDRPFDRIYSDAALVYRERRPDGGGRGRHLLRNGAAGRDFVSLDDSESADAAIWSDAADAGGGGADFWSGASG